MLADLVQAAGSGELLDGMGWVAWLSVKVR